jgi:N-acetylmuramoyl-L-alanine amidase
VKKLLTCLCSLAFLAQAQTILQCRQRFNTYLNFRGGLSGAVKFDDDAIYFMRGGKKEYAIYREELPALSAFFESCTVKQQAQLMRAKGTRKLSRRECDSLLINAESRLPVTANGSTRPLQDLRIAIDPGHFGTTLAEAGVEQKFLYFPKDPVKFPNDSVKLFESSLTFNTAVILKNMLEEQGATVFLSRNEGNFTSFNCTFSDWMSRHRKRTLDSLRGAGVLAEQKYRRLQKCNDYQFFWDFFRDYDLANRAAKINNFNPYLTLIIHYNVDEKNVPWKTHSRKNFSMTFIGGGFTPGDLQREESKMHFMRLLITGQLEQSEKLSALTVSNFSRLLEIPIARQSDATYLAKNCLPTPSRGVFCRNLVLCRKINSPLVYGESLYQDNERETEMLMKSDVDLYGIKTNDRLRKVAQSYFEAVMAFVKETSTH